MLAKTQSMNHELVMPKRYVNLSEEEMEYDGGLWGIVTIVGIAASAVSVVVNVAASAGLVSQQTAAAVTIVCGAISLVTGATALLAAGAAVGKAVAGAYCVSSGVFNTTYGSAGLIADANWKSVPPIPVP